MSSLAQGRRHGAPPGRRRFANIGRDYDVVRLRRRGCHLARQLPSNVHQLRAVHTGRGAVLGLCRQHGCAGHPRRVRALCRQLGYKNLGLIVFGAARVESRTGRHQPHPGRQPWELRWLSDEGLRRAGACRRLGGAPRPRRRHRPDAVDTSAWGGAIANNSGGSVVVSDSTFTGNRADNGGAIANFKFNGSGTVAVSGSTFSDNIAIADGGAIDNADLGGKGTLSVSASTFLANTAAGGDGGAIDNADYSGNGTVVVSGSTFLANTAGGLIGPGDGGAIANAGSNVTGFATSDGAVVVSGSTFLANAATNDGGAIANGGQGEGTLSVSASTFLANTAIAVLGGHGGGAIANGYYKGGKGTLSVSASTFSGGSATNGGIIDNGDNASTGTVWAAADIFNGACYNVAGTWDDEGHNIGANGTCLSAGTGDVSGGADPLGPLAGNGGADQDDAAPEGQSGGRLPALQDHGKAQR